MNGIIALELRTMLRPLRISIFALVVLAFILAFLQTQHAEGESATRGLEYVIGTATAFMIIAFWSEKVRMRPDGRPNPNGMFYLLPLGRTEVNRALTAAWLLLLLVPLLAAGLVAVLIRAQLPNPAPFPWMPLLTLAAAWAFILLSGLVHFWLLTVLNVALWTLVVVTSGGSAGSAGLVDGGTAFVLLAALDVFLFVYLTRRAPARQILAGQDGGRRR